MKPLFINLINLSFLVLVNKKNKSSVSELFRK